MCEPADGADAHDLSTGVPFADRAVWTVREVSGWSLVGREQVYQDARAGLLRTFRVGRRITSCGGPTPTRWLAELLVEREAASR